MKEEHITVPRTLRYYSHGELEASGKFVVALHGYSQHPKFFLNKFKELAQEGDQFVAPEGLHRFYIQGHSGRVGASWMTKEDRLVDIADNISYLNALIDQQTDGHSGERVLMGFSQGCATAVRFFCATEHSFDKLILWAGSFPPDLSLPDNLEKLNRIGIDVVVGDSDEFIFAEHIEELRGLFDQAGLKYRFHNFEGGHDLDIPTLKSIL